MQFIRPNTGSKLTTEAGEDLVFDLNVAEKYDHSARVTDHPVEQGVAISDHIRIEPERFSVTAMFTDSPLHETGFVGRSRDKYDGLVRAMKRRELLTVVTNLRVIENMAITNISVPRLARTANHLYIDISMREVQFAEAADILIPQEFVAVSNTAPVGSSEVNAGRSTADTPSDKTQETANERSSLLFDAAAALGLTNG